MQVGCGSFVIRCSLAADCCCSSTCLIEANRRSLVSVQEQAAVAALEQQHMQTFSFKSDLCTFLSHFCVQEQQAAMAALEQQLAQQQQQQQQQLVESVARQAVKHALQVKDFRREEENMCACGVERENRKQLPSHFSSYAHTQI